MAVRGIACQVQRWRMYGGEKGCKVPFWAEHRIRVRFVFLMWYFVTPEKVATEQTPQRLGHALKRGKLSDRTH